MLSSRNKVDGEAHVCHFSRVDEHQIWRDVRLHINIARCLTLYCSVRVTPS